MAETADIPAWIILFLGIYALSGALGEFVSPGRWASMLEELIASKALQFVMGIVCIALGAAIYLTSPWMPGDWLAMLVTVIGGLTVLEGCVFLSFGGAWLELGRKMLGTIGRGWASLGAAVGLVLVALALSRLL